MKTVFYNTQCAHVWAQQTQETGRSGSMRFEGPTLYSYQTPIAKFYGVDPFVLGIPGDGVTRNRKIVLATSETYSTTTSSKHMLAMRRALSGDVRVFYVPHVELDASKARMQGMGTVGTHLMNLDAMVARYVAVRESELRRRIVYSGSTYGALSEIQRDAIAYAQCFGLPAPTLNAQADADGIERIQAERKAKRETPEYLAKQARSAELKAARDAADNAERIRKEIIQRTRWLNGEHEAWYGLDEKRGAYLRLNGERVETSQGAHIPVDDARRVIPLIRDYATKKSPYAQECREPCGSFTVDRIDANGDIKAGCHFIQFAEIDRIGKLLGV